MLVLTKAGVSISARASWYGDLLLPLILINGSSYNHMRHMCLRLPLVGCEMGGADLVLLCK